MAYAFSRLELTFCINTSRMQISLAYTVYPSSHKEMGDNIITFGGEKKNNQAVKICYI